MLVKEIIIRGNVCKIMCANDESERVSRLTEELNSRIDRIASSVSKKTNDTMLMVLTMLELMDDVVTFGSDIKALEAENYKKDAVIKCVFSCIENIISKLEEGSL